MLHVHTEKTRSSGSTEVIHETDVKDNENYAFRLFNYLLNN